jgi:hypothetical protein
MSSIQGFTPIRGLRKGARRRLVFEHGRRAPSDAPAYVAGPASRPA